MDTDTLPQIYTQENHHIPKEAVDFDARKVVGRLKEQGFEAYIVGGAVRDLLLKRVPKDFDVATSATPDEIRKVFRNSRIIGRRFRLNHVYFKKGKIIEVSTFRCEAHDERNENGDIQIEASNNSWGSPEDDARRRDLTINAFFMDPDEMTIIDYVGGMNDINECRVRVIGDPKTRFNEDPIRMIRTIRHAARTGFLVDPESWDAICEMGGLISECNESRVRQEFIREFQEGAAARSVKMLFQSGLLAHLLPEYHEFINTFDSRPDQKRNYWKLLRYLDKEGAEHTLPTPLIFATALGPAIIPNLLGVFSARDKIEIKLVKNKLNPYLLAVGIPKNLIEPLSQSLYAQPKLDLARKNGSIPKRMADKSYFGLALHLFLLRHKAIGSWFPEKWENKVPKIELVPDGDAKSKPRPKRKRRRGRDERGKTDGNKTENTGQKPKNTEGDNKNQPRSQAPKGPQTDGDGPPKRRRRRRRRKPADQSSGSENTPG